MTRRLRFIPLPMQGARGRRHRKPFPYQREQQWPAPPDYCEIVLATCENTVLALVPIRRTVPITITRMTASITAYSAMSCPSSSSHRSLIKPNILIFSFGLVLRITDLGIDSITDG